MYDVINCDRNTNIYFSNHVEPVWRLEEPVGSNSIQVGPVGCVDPLPEPHLNSCLQEGSVDYTAHTHTQSLLNSFVSLSSQPNADCHSAIQPNADCHSAIIQTHVLIDLVHV